jgi:flagellar protein FliJ
VARFRFNLQAVLDHREMIEQQKQKIVAELETQRVRIEGRIREYQGAIEGERAELRGRLLRADVHGAKRQAAAQMRLVAGAQRAAVELSGVLKRLDIARAELLEATKRRKAVDLLRERRFEDWKRDQSRRELSAVDELAVMAAGRASQTDEVWR